MKKNKNPNLEYINNNLPHVDVLPDYLTSMIEEALVKNDVTEDGNLFLDEELSNEIVKKIAGSPSLTYYSKTLEKTILLVGYYAPNIKDIKAKKENFLQNPTLAERKQIINHIYFSLPLPQNELSSQKLDEVQHTDINTIQKDTNQKSIKKLISILDRKSMNSEGYIFLNENERDELGEEFLLNTRKIQLDDYVRTINFGGVKQEVELAMEKRYANYSFDTLNKYKNLNTIIYPIFPNQKVKGREYKSGFQATDKKQIPLYFWLAIMGICFAASICIIIWTFGFVIPSTATQGIFYNPNPPVDGALVIQSLFPNAWTFFSHIAASITIFLFLFFFAWRPMKEAIEKRENYIAGQIQSAERLNKEADIKLEYATRQELISYVKANEIMENAIRSLNNKKDLIEKEAKTNADKIKENAVIEAQKIHENLKNKINDEIVNNSLAIAKELLKRNVSSSDNQQFVDDFIKNLESNK